MLVALEVNKDPVPVQTHLLGVEVDWMRAQRVFELELDEVLMTSEVFAAF